MLTEDKITEIYSIADDFCKVFDVELEKIVFPMERNIETSLAR